MLTSGAVAAQSALTIVGSADATFTGAPGAVHERTASYGSVPYTGARAEGLRLARR